MGKKRRRDLKRVFLSVGGLIVVFLILVLLNVILSYANVRWDLTEDRIYSLSQGTKNVLAKIAEPVTVKFFCSRSNRDLPRDLKLYANRVLDFLSEYERAGHGTLRVEIYDPRPDSDEEEWAQKYGIQALRTPGGDSIYCGLVFLSADREDTIPTLDPTREGLLEYDITRIIHRLETPKRKVVGIISSLPLFGLPAGMVSPGNPSQDRPWFLISELQKTYELKRIEASSNQIESSVDLLLIIHPKNLSPQLEYAIDQYVLSGGNALVFVDPFCVSDRTQGGRPFVRPSASSLKRLFRSWGLSLDPGKALADLAHPTRVRTINNRVEDSPVWISVRADALNRKDIITSQLESLLFPVAGAISKAQDKGYEFEPLVQSSKDSELIEAFKAGFGATAIRRDFVSADKAFNIAVRVRGQFETAFPEGPPKPKKTDGSKSEKDKQREETSESNTSLESTQIKKAKRPSTVVVVADADMLADRFYIQRGSILGLAISKVFNDNLNFLLNACEILTGSDDLIGLRSRGKVERPFTAVLALERKAQKRWLAKEKELEKKVEETNRKLRELEQRKDASQRLIISPEQEKEIAEFREEKRRIRKELKQVRKNLRADIEALGSRLKWLNILLMPLCISIAGVLFAIHKQRKMKRP